jgi:hypothetical protein
MDKKEKVNGMKWMPVRTGMKWMPVRTTKT